MALENELSAAVMELIYLIVETLSDAVEETVFNVDRSHLVTPLCLMRSLSCQYQSGGSDQCISNCI